MKLNKKGKIICSASAAAAVLVISTLICLGNWYNERQRNAEIIRKAITNPQNLEPEKFLNTIDESFHSLPEQKKRRILKDRELMKKYVAEATSKELSKSFKVLFCLPKPLRKKIIKTSAERLLDSARKDPKRVTATFNSVAGHGALRGASRFFLLNLSGEEKAEVAPLTAAMYEIVRQQSKGIKLKKH
jgi:hypothetical protein